jgi:cobalamin synthase
MNEAGFVGVARRQLNTFLAAVMFLTRLPVSRFHEFREEEVASSTIYFPIVGALVGLAGGLALLMSAALPSFVAVLISMLVTICLTGGLHEDGLADSADGLIGGRDPQRRLEIMKDSRIGAYGALALWFSLTAKLILVQSLLAAGLVTAISASVIAHCLGRAATVATNLSPVRPDRVFQVQSFRKQGHVPTTRSGASLRYCPVAFAARSPGSFLPHRCACRHLRLWPLLQRQDRGNHGRLSWRREPTSRVERLSFTPSTRTY